MTDTTRKIVEAAVAMFARYGFNKTTMGDIASEAGVARQTVYNAFHSKDDILRAVVRHSGQVALHAVQSDWAAQAELADRLDSFHIHAPIAWYEAIRAAPDWGALLDGVHAAAAEELASLDAEWKAAIAQMLVASQVRPIAPDMSIDDVVEFFYAASLNAKYGATDLSHLQRRLRTIKIATLALLTVQ